MVTGLWRCLKASNIRPKTVRAAGVLYAAERSVHDFPLWTFRPGKLRSHVLEKHLAQPDALPGQAVVMFRAQYGALAADSKNS